MENSLLVLLWFRMATMPAFDPLNTTLGPIPQPNSIPVLYLSFSRELTPVSILVKTRELSLEEQLSTNGPSGFISLSTVTNSIIEFELTTRFFTGYPVLTLNSFSWPGLDKNLPFLVAANIMSGRKMQGCNWHTNESLGMLIYGTIDYTTWNK